MLCEFSYRLTTETLRDDTTLKVSIPMVRYVKSCNHLEVTYALRYKLGANPDIGTISAMVIYPRRDS